MKHRVREAIFNLVGIECRDRHAIDIFAGTGAIGLEALSRGAASATFIERHVPTARTVEENIRNLDVGHCTELLITSAFLWSKRDLPEFAVGRPGLGSSGPADSKTDERWLGAERSWILFCSPPFDFYVERHDEMNDLIQQVLRLAPTGSTLVVEADERLDFGLLPAVWGDSPNDDQESAEWDVRAYPPAIVGVLRHPKTDA